MVVLFHHRLQFLRRMERHDAARRDRDLFPRLGVSARTLRLVAQLEIAEAGKFHAAAGLECEPDLFEERFNHVLRFAFIEADLLKEKVGEFRLRQSHLFPFQRNFALNRCFSTERSCSTADSTSASVKVLRVSCNNTLNARLFFPFSTPVPRYMSNRPISSTIGGWWRRSSCTPSW